MLSADSVDVLLDVDTGVDDAHALLLALRHPGLNVVGVTTVAGNMDIKTVTTATLKVLDAADAPMDLPVAMGCAHPLIEPTHFCPQIHGNDALGDLEPPLPPSARTVVKEHAVTFLISLLQQRVDTNQSPLVLIALAPLTNIAMVVRMAPDVFKKAVAKVVWMGGAAFAGGNASQWGEANAAYDPEAAHIVLSSCGVPVYMYTWDVYLKVAFDTNDLVEYGCFEEEESGVVEDGKDGNGQDRGGKGDESGGESSGEISNKSEGEENTKRRILRKSASSWTTLATRLLLRDMSHFTMKAAQIGDAGAVAAVLCPEAITTKHMHVVVEMKGDHTRGMTVVDGREEVCPPDKPKEKPNVHVVLDCDVEILKRCFADVVFS